MPQLIYTKEKIDFERVDQGQTDFGHSLYRRQVTFFLSLVDKHMHSRICGRHSKRHLLSTV